MTLVLGPAKSPQMQAQSIPKSLSDPNPAAQKTDSKSKSHPVMNALPYSFCAAILAASFAQAETATTTPVGYVTMNVPANADTTITPPLSRPALLVTASTSITGNNVEVSGLTGGAFVSPECYLEVTSGVLIGRIFPIIANTTTTITVQVPVTNPVSTLQDLGFVATNSFKVVPYWTLNTLFPQGVGVGTSADALNPTSTVMASAATGYGLNKSSSNSYFYCTGDTENGVLPGWYDANDPFTLPLDNLRIDPSRMYAIRTSSVVAQNVVVTGQVQDVSTSVIPVAVTTFSNDNYLSAPYAVDVSLPDSGLQSAIQASPDALNPIERVFVYADDAVGKNKSSSKGYFYCSGDTENGVLPGWYDVNDPFTPPITEKVIKAGRCLVIRKAPYLSTGTIPWIAPRPYSIGE